MAEPRVVLLNDTDVDGYHFGCSRVMSTINGKLSDRGITPIGSVAVSLNWQDNHTDLVNSADVLVINGEGTLHHGSRKGRWLLEAAQSVKARGGRVALINALWQENPADWADLIRDVDILSCRDSRSAAEMRKAVGRDVRMIGDLSLANPIAQNASDRNGILFGDSVHAKITTKLAELASDTPDAELVPVTSSLKFVSPDLSGIRRSLRSAYSKQKQKAFLSRNPKARFVSNEADYLGLVSQKSLSVTGRFHAVCLAISTQTPFIAISSNSWKIEALIEDIGLSHERIMQQAGLKSADLLASQWSFSDKEANNIYERLAKWRSDTDALFDEIAALG